MAKLQIILTILFVLCYGSTSNETKFKLKQVFAISRHNIRTPLVGENYIADVTPYSWPKWREEISHLTQKGAKTESYMGTYFSERLRKQGLIQNGCPPENTIYIYANTRQRCIASAEAFSGTIYPECNVTVHFNTTVKYSLLFPGLHNGTETFIDAVLKEMAETLAMTNLTDAFSFLENVLEYKNSSRCLEKHDCNTFKEKHEFKVEGGKEVGIEGPLKLAAKIVDAFIMEYFEGFDIENVAWGKIRKDEDWRQLFTFIQAYRNVLYNNTMAAKDVARPIVNFMREQFSNEDRKLSILFGHDTNIFFLLKVLNFKPYSIPNNFDNIPLGGKILFQKWYEEVNGRDLLKIEYVYQSNEQLRNGKKLSLTDPPLSVVLELSSCRTDADGFCDWSEFMELLNNPRTIPAGPTI